MKTICLYFEIHQIVHLKRYRFFDIGTDHYYYDDYENERSINHIAECSYMPALNTLQKMIQDSNGYFKCAFSISGVGMEQLEVHAPQVLDKLQELNKTGCVEFLAEPYSHGLSSLKDSECFAADVRKQCKRWSTISAINLPCCATPRSSTATTSDCRPHSSGSKGCLPREPNTCSDGNHHTMSTTAPWLLN